MKIFTLCLLSAIIFTPFRVSAIQTFPEQCGIQRHWVRSHFRKAYTRADGKHFSASKVAAHCSDNPPSYSYWKPRLKSGIPPEWPLKGETAKPWSDDEIEKIIEALGYLPNEMKRNDILGIYRMGRSIFYPNPASADRVGNIAVYDQAFSSAHNLAQVLSHEIAHRIFETLGRDDFERYSFAAGWIARNDSNGSKEYVLLRKKMVDSDSSDSVEEDFSNNVEFYLFNPAKLKDVSPEAFNWISRHFGANFKVGKGSP